LRECNGVHLVRKITVFSGETTMKRFIATTALALVMASPAYLAHSEMKELSAIERLEQGDILASTLIGMRIYATENDVDAEPYEAGAEREWDDLGEVDDVILTKDGSVKAVILGIGGFLGIGERDIAIDMSSLNFVRENDDADDFFLVVNANKEVLEKAPAYETHAEMEADEKAADKDKMAKAETAEKDQMAAKDADNAVKMDKSEKAEMAKAEASDKDRMATADRGPMLVRPTVEREGYRDAEARDITADMLEGARVYGSDDEDVGEIDRLIISQDGQIEHAVVDVGGFLGLGEHPIAVTMDELQILREENGGGVRIFIDSTQSELEKKPAYRG
jgi:hypothetical protein